MHYYQFNIADYRKDTQHLSPIEHYIYRELMDWYYLDEALIINDTAKITRRLRLDSESADSLEIVLNEFFTLTNEGWSHGRIELEITAYRDKAETARVNGRKGGRPLKPRKTQPVILANPEITQAKANSLTHKPINSSKEMCGANAPPAKKPRKVFVPPVASEVAEYLAEKNNTNINPDYFVDFYAARGWKLNSGTKMVDWKAAVRTWINREEKGRAQNRPSSNSGQNRRKLTPGERVKARHDERYGGKPTGGASDMETVVSVQ